jgi:hypothetical protein
MNFGEGETQIVRVLGCGSPVVYFCDRAAWWGGLAGVGATLGTCARQRWLWAWYFSGGPRWVVSNQGSLS